MKKLNTNNTGRMPLWQADLDWIQQAYKEPIEAIMDGLAIVSDYFLITGCRIRKYPDDNHLTMSNGMFWWGGEVLPVKALDPISVSAISDPVIRLDRVTHYDTDGSRNFIRADQSSETVTDVWQEDYLEPHVIERSALTAIDIAIQEGVWPLHEILKHSIGGYESEWITISGLQYGQSLRYKQIGRTVILNGRLRITTESTPVATGLPAPLGGSVNLITGKYKGEYENLHWNFDLKAGELYAYVDNSGNLIVRQIDHDTTSDDFVFLNGMTYIAANAYVPSGNPYIVVTAP